MFILKLREKNSSANVRFKIFVSVFRARKLCETFEKRAPGPGGPPHLSSSENINATAMKLEGI